MISSWQKSHIESFTCEVRDLIEENLQWKHLELPLPYSKIVRSHEGAVESTAIVIVTKASFNPSVWLFCMLGQAPSTAVAAAWDMVSLLKQNIFWHHSCSY